jgi:mRNA interferase MazF
MLRGEVWWASLPDPLGSGPGFRRPLLIVSADSFNRSRIQTVLAAVVTTNLKLAAAPGNLRLAAGTAGLKQASVINVSQLITVDKAFLQARVGKVPARVMRDIDSGLRLVLGLESVPR